MTNRLEVSYLSVSYFKSNDQNPSVNPRFRLPQGAQSKRPRRDFAFNFNSRPLPKAAKQKAAATAASPAAPAAPASLSPSPSPAPGAAAAGGARPTADDLLKVRCGSIDGEYSISQKRVWFEVGPARCIFRLI